jgi:hypothetical protein
MSIRFLKQQKSIFIFLAADEEIGIKLLTVKSPCKPARAFTKTNVHEKCRVITLSAIGTV